MPPRRRLNPFTRSKPTVHRYADRVAAHQIASPATAGSPTSLGSLQLEPWQEKILRYSTIVPEVMTGYSFVHNVIDRIQFEIERFDRTSNEWVSDETPAMQGIERRINTAFRAGRAAALMHLIEECFVLVSRENGEFVFETLAPTEIRLKNNERQKRLWVEGKEAWIRVEDETTSIRIYTPDPANRYLAGGPHKSLTGLLETMALELMRDQSDSISILAGNGILYIPTEILPDESDTLDASDTPWSRRGFEDRLEEAMTATINDRQHPDAIVPITLYGPAEFAKDIRHIVPGRDENAMEVGARMDRYIQRYARDIDLPAQIILGLGDTNHWTDWKVDENTWAYHLEPRALRIADAVYDGLIRSIIVAIGFDGNDYRLVPNAAGAVAQQDKSSAAHEAYKVGALTPEAYIEAIGFGPSDMRADAEETLLEIVAGAKDFPPESDVLVEAPPDRTAASVSSNPRVILRGATKIANQQQRQLGELYRRIMNQVAEDAAKGGRAAQRERDKTAAADPVAFEGYEPGVYFAKYRDVFEEGTRKQLYTLLRRVATLTGTDYLKLRTIWSNEFTNRARTVTAIAEKAATSIERASFKSGKPARIMEANIRSMTSAANGGSSPTNSAAANIDRPTMASEDPALREPIAEVAGSFVTAYTWVHDDPARPFPPHEELDGRTWYQWEEGDALDHGGDSFPGGSVYFPGDHDGCLCEYSVEFVSSDDIGGQ